MPTQTLRARGGLTLAVGAAGAGAGPLVAYAVAFADPRQRAGVLHDTGHGYFAVALWLAWATATLTLAAVAARSASPSAADRDHSVVPGFALLAAWQAGLFLAAEAAERAVAGGPLAEMIQGRELMVGLALQVVVAAVIVLLLGATNRICARLAARLRRPVPYPDARAMPGATSPSSHRRLAISTTRSRAPPGLAPRPRLTAAS